MPKDEQYADTDARLTVRLDPQYHEAVKQAAMELGTNPTSLVRNAIQEYVERQERFLSTPVFRIFKFWRSRHNRADLL